MSKAESTESHLEKLVNGSGFLFQVALEEHLKGTAQEHGWEVLTREHPWASSSKDGYIDLVLGRGGLRAVIECKRTRDADWIFLAPSGEDDRATLRAHWTFGDTQWGHGWADFSFDPVALHSEFCIVRGSSDQDKPMLERIAGEVLRATESLAREEMNMSGRQRGSKVYIPVIVTNARLQACFVDPKEVDLATGDLPSTARFKEVGVVHFRKAMPSDVTHGPSLYSSFAKGLALKERATLVVNVEHLVPYLRDFKERQRSVYDQPYPWANLRG